jgi:hypothetical protein
VSLLSRRDQLQGPAPLVRSYLRRAGSGCPLRTRHRTARRSVGVVADTGTVVVVLTAVITVAVAVNGDEVTGTERPGAIRGRRNKVLPTQRTDVPLRDGASGVLTRARSPNTCAPPQAIGAQCHGVMRLVETPQHSYKLLTKHPRRAAGPRRPRLVTSTDRGVLDIARRLLAH